MLGTVPVPQDSKVAIMIQSLLSKESGNGQCIPGTVLCVYLITDVLGADKDKSIQW